MSFMRSLSHLAVRIPGMRVLLAPLGAIGILIAAGCADQGNLVIRCPDSGGLIAVAGGQVTIDGVQTRVTADLTAASGADHGMTFVIEVQRVAAPADLSPTVECVRMSKPDRGERWDATASHVQEFRDNATMRILASDGDGPHWVTGDLIDVVIWLKTTTGRHVLSLGRQPVHP
jgi:hypothetical protein